MDLNPQNDSDRDSEIEDYQQVKEAVANMAPPPTRSAEHNEFIAKLAAYHQKRGTHFEPEPKIGSKYVDLLQLYNVVLERGGYDKVTEVKTLWLKIGTDELNLDKGVATIGFNLKTVYYKNLAAYEISTVHGREPPPKQILEDLTAKGGNLLTRTLENFQPPRGRDTGANSEASGDDGTPSRERNASEETPGSGGRASRGLRAQPPARVLFQDTQNVQQPRMTRNATSTSHPGGSQQSQAHHQAQQQSQAPRGASTSYNPSSNVENMSPAVTNYEPRPIRPMEDLRPVVTPGNNANEFARRQKALALAGQKQPPNANKGIILPGSGFDGPNIYVRCLCALRSGIRSEQDYALHHLVKISMERGDKFKFESFPGLAEGLLEKLFEVSSLFYKVEWQITYMPEGVGQPDTINGLDGTPDILSKIAALEKLQVDDNFQSAEFTDAMLQINEAGLTLRNMVMLEDNAYYVSENALLRDFLSIALNLPELNLVVELKHYALDIAEQLTKYMHFEETDPLYISLLAQVHSSDRGAILTALRAIGRISMNLDEPNNLKGIPLSVILKIVDWPHLNDEELVHACLDFLYQYTAVVDNVNFLLKYVQLEPLVNQLTRLLLHNAKSYTIDVPIGNDYRLPAPESIAPLPQQLYHELLKLEEPERSSTWLRSLFEEDPLESITQIALWQAYQNCFTPAIVETGVPLLAAADFIKNVSTTFADKANAQVQGGITQKFIIKGIRYRSIPVDRHGEEYKKCFWTGHDGNHCGQFFMGAEQMYNHIVKVHLGGTESPDGKFINTSGSYTCAWGTCERFKDEPASKLMQIAGHIKVHLPPKATSIKPSDTSGLAKKPSYIVTAPKYSLGFQSTAVDENNDAAGIPLSAVLVLRNLARNIPKTEIDEITVKEEGVSWVDKLFLPVQRQLFEVMAVNRPLAVYLTDLIIAIKA